MKNVSKSRLTALVSAILVGAWLSVGLPGLSAAADAPGKVVLSNSDCVKCHAKPVADIDAKGGKHKSEIGCQDCHSGHPPAVKKIIPECSQCHSGKPHYKLKGCLGCHKNPHTPKVITFAKSESNACLTCHAPQIKQLQDNKSKHTALACAFCHDIHGKKPLCTSCHKTHSADIVPADCQKCHKAHMPKVVTYAAETPSKWCAACHKKAYDLLAASKAKHSKLPCTTCHVAKHKTVPKCQDCHGTPHPAGMMAKFTGCKECHYTAHDLNNLPAASAKGETPAAKKTKKKK
jgi:predicted CXXCH cytochrome family protein